MKKTYLILTALVFGMSLFAYADDDKTTVPDPGRPTDTHGYVRSNEVNKGKQGEAMRAKHAKNKEEKEEIKKDSKDAREARKEMREEKHNAKNDK